MRSLIITLVFLSASLDGFCQDYKILSYQDSYTELDTFTSLGVEVLGELGWEKRFELGFDFPFFEDVYDYIICTNAGFCDFEGSVDFTIRLLTFGYEYDIILDPTNVPSDVRYHYTIKDGMKALVLQFTKIRLERDPSIEEFDSYMNFQWWFYEDGSIDIRFGDINLDNSPCYVPGDGFYLFFSNAGFIPTGPGVALFHPRDTLNKVVLNGDYDDFIITNNIGVLETLPPEGWVIRFERDLVNTQDLDNSTTKVFPNPSDGVINIESDEVFISYQLLNIQGQLVKRGEIGTQKIEISEIPEGLYILKLLDQNSKLRSEKITILHPQ